MNWSPDEGLVDMRREEETMATGRRSMPMSQVTEAEVSREVDSSARAKSLAEWRREPNTNSYWRKLEKVTGTRGREVREETTRATSATTGDRKEGRDGRSQEARAPSTTSGVQREATADDRDEREERETSATSVEEAGMAPRSTGFEEEVTEQQTESGAERPGR